MLPLLAAKQFILIIQVDDFVIFFYRKYHKSGGTQWDVVKMIVTLTKFTRWNMCRNPKTTNHQEPSPDIKMFLPARHDIFSSFFSPFKSLLALWLLHALRHSTHEFFLHGCKSCSSTKVHALRSTEDISCVQLRTCYRRYRCSGWLKILGLYYDNDIYENVIHPLAACSTRKKCIIINLKKRDHEGKIKPKSRFDRDINEFPISDGDNTLRQQNLTYFLGSMSWPALQL